VRASEGRGRGPEGKIFEELGMAGVGNGREFREESALEAQSDEADHQNLLTNLLLPEDPQEGLDLLREVKGDLKTPGGGREQEDPLLREEELEEGGEHGMVIRFLLAGGGQLGADEGKDRLGDLFQFLHPQGERREERLGEGEGNSRQ
jgi:hypothetical protein